MSQPTNVINFRYRIALIKSAWITQTAFDKAASYLGLARLIRLVLDGFLGSAVNTRFLVGLHADHTQQRESWNRMQRRIGWLQTR